MKTKDKIKQSALKLFNTSGSDKISTNHIAKATGISIGNLYYHYKNKEEIIFDIWKEMVKETDPLWEIRPPYTLNELKNIIDQLQNQLWSYRFFQKELSQLLAKNSSLKKAYSESRKTRIKKIKSLFLSMRSNGLFNPLFTDEIIDSSIITCWIIMDFWLPYQNISETTETHQVAELILNLLKPYFNIEIQ